MKEYKIVYMGTPVYASEILNALLEDPQMSVELVLTQPDKPVGRKKVLTPPPVKSLALSNNIEVLQPYRLSDDGIEESIKRVKPDFIIVAAFGQILPKNILDIAPCINLHASLLPYYRGASPIQQALLNGDKQTGVTSMLMEEGLDTGPMLDKIVFDIPDNMRLQELTRQLTLDAAKITLTTIKNYDTKEPQKQDDSIATVCKKIKKSDGEIDFVNALEIYNKYRAFEGWPGIFFSNGTKFDNIELIDKESSFNILEVLKIDNDGIVVGCSIGSLKIGSIQPPSKKMINAKDYCVGRGIKVGDTIF